MSVDSKIRTSNVEPSLDPKAQQIKALDAEARAAGLTDHDRHEVLAFLSLLQEKASNS